MKLITQNERIINSSLQNGMGARRQVRKKPLLAVCLATGGGCLAAAGGFPGRWQPWKREVRCEGVQVLGRNKE